MGSCYKTWADSFRDMSCALLHAMETLQLSVDDEEIVTRDAIFDIRVALDHLECHLDKQNRDDIAEYKDDDIEAIFYNDLNNLMITKSKYKTRANLCSPCYPNAGDLDSCNDASVNITYCLGPDWFEDGKMPYKILEE